LLRRDYLVLDAVFIETGDEAVAMIFTDRSDQTDRPAQFRERQGGVGRTAGKNPTLGIYLLRFDVIVNRVAYSRDHKISIR
jgi:hypothetical protein